MQAISFPQTVGGKVAWRTSMYVSTALSVAVTVLPYGVKSIASITRTNGIFAARFTYSTTV